MTPYTANEDEINYFAKTNFRNVWKLFGIRLDDRRRHLYVIGKTGMGKSTMLENMVVQDIRNGHGLALVDPHGDAVEKILDYIPSNRVNDVIYFNPADIDHPIAFNVLESVDPTHRHLVSSGLIAIFKKLWIDSWGPRLEYVLRNTILALIEYPGSTLLGVTRMLVDKNYRSKVIAKLTDPIVKAFWVDEFNAYSNQFRTEAVSPIQNKVGQYLSSSIIRNIVGQPQSSVDLRDAIDSGKIILMNLAKGRIGEDNSQLLGAMLITKLQLAAMSRINIAESERRDFFLYVDEFQNFATESFANILSEARKYRLNLIIAHQYIEQLTEEVRAAVFGNVGTLVCFRIGAADSEFLQKEFDPVFSESDLVNLTKYDVYLKLMINGLASDPFSATTLPPISRHEGNAETVIRVARERYASPRERVEEKIARWAAGVHAGEAGQPIGARPPRGRPPERRERDTPRTIPPPQQLEPVAHIPTEAPISLAQALTREPQPFHKAGPPSAPKRRAFEPRRDRSRHRHHRPPRANTPGQPQTTKPTPPPSVPPSAHVEDEPTPIQPGQVVQVKDE
ncbi:MAG: type IV secretion system DNA-binding domain-containing protein [Candidatus Kerfeldbacteria bacterium]|nr:type IV secretion system DNA-binding domain-containing protein [Candidatus Kerfeldbacteria bacterium]